MKQMNVEDINSFAESNVYLDTHTCVLRIDADGASVWDADDRKLRNVASLRILDIATADEDAGLQPKLHTIELTDANSGNELASAAWKVSVHHAWEVRSSEKRYVLPVPSLGRVAATVRCHGVSEPTEVRGIPLLVVCESKTLNARPPAFFNTGTLNPHYTPDFMSYIVNTCKGDQALSKQASSSLGDEVDEFFEQHLRN